MRTSAKEKRIREEVPIALERMGFRFNGESDIWSMDDFIIRLKIEKASDHPSKRYVLEVVQGAKIIRKLNAARLWQRSLKRLLLLSKRARKHELRERSQLSSPQNCINDELRKPESSGRKLPILLEKQPDPISISGVVVKFLRCHTCEEIKPIMEMYPGTPAVCCDCVALKTMGEQKPAEIKVGTAAAVLQPQLALFESEERL